MHRFEDDRDQGDERHPHPDLGPEGATDGQQDGQRLRVVIMDLPGRRNEMARERSVNMAVNGATRWGQAYATRNGMATETGAHRRLDSTRERVARIDAAGEERTPTV